MADPLSIASAIAGIIALAGSVVSLSYKYGCAVRDGPMEIQNLLDELINLTGILNAVKTLIESSNETRNLDPTDAGSHAPPPYSKQDSMVRFQTLSDTTENTEELLAQVQKALQKSEFKSEHRMGRVVKRLLWPLKKEETANLVARLERLKTSFMLVLNTAHIDFESEIRDTVQDIRDLQRVERLERQAEKNSAALKSTCRWLCPVNPVDSHRSAHQSRMEGTGSWMLEHHLWKDWLQAEKSFLWLYGIPGAGKTVLTCTLLENCLNEIESQETFVLYFYCDFRQKESSQAEYVLGGLITQLCSQSQNSQKTLMEFETEHRDHAGNRSQPAAKDLKNLLLKLLNDVPSYILVIDGLDECQNRECILELLTELINHVKNSSKILVSSRAEADIMEAFASRREQSIRVSAVDSDIESYISNAIYKSPRLSRMKLDLKTTVQQTMLANAHGMFRWVQCQMDNLARLRTDRAIRSALTKLPRDLTETYNMMLDRIDEADFEVALRALTWMAYASRPLRLDELAEAVIITPDTLKKDPEATWHPPDLLWVIGSFALYDDTRDMITLAHYSVKEHLETGELTERTKRFRLTPESGIQELAETCLKYLLLEDFNTGPCGSRALLVKRWEDYPLLQYASRYWPLHAKQHLDTSKTTLDLSCQLFKPGKNPHFKSWLESMISQGYFRYNQRRQLDTSFATAVSTFRLTKSPSFMDGNRKQETAPNFVVVRDSLSPLYYASSFGLVPVVKYLIDQGEDVNHRGGLFNGTPLHAAAYRHNHKVLKLLVNAGADPMIRDNHSTTPLAMARGMSADLESRRILEGSLMGWIEKKRNGL